MLGWLVLSAVPLLIHWLFRRQYREVSWGAMQFLHEAVRKQSRRSRIEQLLLLLTRISVLVLIVLALSGPRWADAGRDVKAATPTLRIVVLDCSLSMSRAASGQAGGSLFDSAKRAARETVSRAAAGDRLVLARIAGTEPRLLIRQPTLLNRIVLDEIDRTAMTFERGDVAATLRAVQEIATGRSANERCEVTFLSDFQADNWVDADLTELAQQSSVVLSDAGAGASNNGAVVGLEFERTFISSEQPLRVTAVIRQVGWDSVPTARSVRRVELLLNDQVIDAQQIESGDDETRVVFQITTPESGEHMLSARLDDDALTADNQFWRTLSIRPQINVLLVNGRSASRSRDSATFYVERALAPKLRESRLSNVGESQLRWRVRSLPESEFSQTELTEFDVIFLCDPPRLSEADAERLRRFEQSGGGLIVSLGPLADVTNLNETLFGPRGVMPVKLSEIVGPLATDGVPTAVGFDTADESHPLLREFRGNPGSGLETALIRQFVRTEISPKSAVQTPIKFTSGESAILTHPLGAGRCVLITTSVDETWGAWAVFAPGFVPLMHELVEYVVPGSFDRDMVLVGESVSRPLRLASVDEAVVAVLPNGERRQQSVQEVDGVNVANVSGTLRPGALQLRSSTDDRVLAQIAVNVDPRESDSQRLDRERLKPMTAAAPGVVFHADGERVERQTDTAHSTSATVVRIGLLAVLMLLLVELALAWRLVAAGWLIAVFAVGLAIVNL